MASRISFILCLVFVGVAPAMADQAGVWLDRMSHSFRELSYEGTVSYQRGDSMQSLRISHAVIDGKEFERLEYLDGDRREIVRRAHNLDCIHPGHQMVRFFPVNANSKAAHGENSVVDFYDVEITGKGRIADRTVMNLAVTPKDTHRYGYRLSLDEASGLLLRSELIGDGGKVLERFQFVEVAIGADIPAARFQPHTGSYQADHSVPVAPGLALVDTPPATDKPVETAGERWLPGWLPAGFTPADTRTGAAGDSMMTYTDGLAVFSVFLEPEGGHEGVDVAEGSARRGATTAYFKALILAGQPHRVTVVGEIPQHTAQEVAASIALIGAP